jgi:hypothetical protein
MRIEDAAASDDASQALLRHIREHFGTVPAFCEAKGLDRVRVQKAIRGKPKKFDVGFAFAIEKATDGAVPASLWVREGTAA